MLFKPTYSLEIISEDNFFDKICQVEQQLSQCGTSGYFLSPDNKKLFYEYFLCENAKANIVIVHGLSEFTKKFYEVTYYFLSMGYNVFMFDQRCHGLSQRLTPDRDVLHVDSYQDYVNDLEKFIDEIVLQVQNKPIYIYSHSMGGAVTVLFLEKHKNVKKAILSAPLFEPIIGVVSPPIARAGVGMASFFVNKKNKFPLSKDFNPEVKYNPKADASFARWTRHINLRKNNEMYQTTPMSWGWVNTTLKLRLHITSRVSKRITAPVLLISAKNDTVVDCVSHSEFAQNCKNCKIEFIENCGHAILSGDERILREHLTSVFKFLDD